MHIENCSVIIGIGYIQCLNRYNLLLSIPMKCIRTLLYQVGLLFSIST